jgi:large subunit ribosomal protein L10
MNLQEKKDQVEKLKAAFEKAQVGILTQLNGIDVAAVTELRKQLRQAGTKFKVVKNSLAKRAAKGTAMDAVAEDFTGPVGLAYGEDPITPAKVLTKFIKDLPPEREGWISIKAGMLAGQRLDAKAVVALSTMAGLPELRARIVGLIAAPAQTLVRLIATPSQQVARVIDAHAKALPAVTEALPPAHGGETQAKSA